MIRILLFALVPLLRGQSPPVVATTAVQPDGRVTLTIQNLTGSMLTAYSYKIVGWGILPDGGRGGGLTEIGYKDAAVELGINPIPPNQQIVLPFLNGEVTFEAALWADGTSYGDAVWVNRLRERRALAQLHNTNALTILDRALDSGTDTRQVIKELQDANDDVNGEDIGILRGYYQIPLRWFANPNGYVRNVPDGTPVHRTDREVIQDSIAELQRRLDRMQQYR